MVTEDYVSLETAKLLKEKGFDEKCMSYYGHGEFQLGHPKYMKSNTDRDGVAFNGVPYDAYNAPTLQMAMKWLRREHNLHCNSDYDIVLGWYCQITSLTETVEYDYEEMKHYHPDKDNGFSSPEEACEEAIKYCLEKLI